MESVMRKSSFYFSVALFLIMALSCTKEKHMDNVKEEREMSVLQCDIELSMPRTKTELLADASTVVWETKDEISVLSADETIDYFHLISGTASTSGTFAGSLTGSAPYTAFYPASGKASIVEGELSFHLPESQNYAKNSFGSGASPMIAAIEDISQPIQFRNLCGLLCLKLAAKPSFRVSKLVIKDLAGNMLWGDCRLSLDGTQGTDEQTMTISGGSDEITLLLSPVRYLPDDAPLKLYVAVPPGAFGDGFSVTAYDENGEVYAVLKTLNGAAVIERSVISNMAPLKIKSEPADPKRRGYYKDLFMDSGIQLVNRSYLAGAESIHWDYEYQSPVRRYTTTENDRILQRTIFLSAEDDENGYLLYPDRQPRYRCIYVNGGYSRGHGSSLGAAGRKTIYDFVYNGGAYVGTCAGAFIACKGYDTVPISKYYLGIFPGHMYHTVIKHDRPDLIMPMDSPLRAYFDFGGTTISSVLHSGGGYMSEEEGHVPDGTEVLLRYGNWPSGTPSDEGKVAIWAYKPDESTGRMVLCGSHPESGTTENKNNFDLFSAMLLYAADGNGVPPVKATLDNGQWYRCETMSSENDPAHARIGDKQYHHFTVDIPEGAKNLVIKLKSEWTEEDLYLSMNKGDYAWTSEADYVNDDDGSNKTLIVRKPEAGTWFLSVYAPNTVTATLTTYDTNGLYYKYTGKTHLLNGIPYSIKVDWE